MNNRRLNLNNNRAFQLLFNPGMVSRPMEIQENDMNDMNNMNNMNDNILYSNSQFYYFDNNQRILLFESTISNTKLSIGGGNKEYDLSVDTNNKVFITIKKKRVYLINEMNTIQLWSKDFTEQFFPDVLLLFIKIPEFCLKRKNRNNELMFEEPDSNLFSRLEVDRMSSLTRGLGNLKSSRARKPRLSERQMLDANLAPSRIAEADRLAEEEEYNDMQQRFPLFKRRKNSFGFNLNLQKIRRYLVSL